MTTNASGKLNTGGASAIVSITAIPPDQWSDNQRQYLNACLTALAHQPARWYSYQDWGEGGPVAFLAARGIEFHPVANPRPEQKSWYDGCNCDKAHWEVKSKEGE